MILFRFGMMNKLLNKGIQSYKVVINSYLNHHLQSQDCFLLTRFGY